MHPSRWMGSTAEYGRSSGKIQCVSASTADPVGFGDHGGARRGKRKADAGVDADADADAGYSSLYVTLGLHSLVLTTRRLGIPLDAFLAVTRQQSCMSSIIFVVVSVTSPLHRVKVGLDAARPEVIMVVMIPPSRSPT